MGDLDSTFIKYLESTSLDRARKAARYEVFNSAKPKENKLSEAQKITATDYFDRICLIAGLFGFSLFEEVPKESQISEFYYLEDVKNKDASGRGTLLDSGEFVVFAGSKVRVKETEGLKKHGPNVIALRRKLKEEGVLQEDGEGESYVLKTDHVFTSPSLAATFVAARACNGWDAWKDEKGKTLDENKRK